MTKVLKIILTNLVHLLGFYVTICLFTILSWALGLSWENESWHFVLNNIFLSTNGLMFGYGPMVIGGFYTVLIVLDIICFGLLSMNAKEALIAEWLLISIPFFYWAFEHHYWLWITLSLSFLGTQLARKTAINSILNIAT